MQGSGPQGTRVPITRERHGGRFWKRFASYDFARPLQAVPLVLAEAGAIAASLPLVFLGRGAASRPVALLRLRAAGGSVFVSPGGLWLGTCVPAALRVYPFAAEPLASDRIGLLIDESSGLVSDDQADQPFFAADGSPAPALDGVVGFFRQYVPQQQATAAAAAALAPLLVPLVLPGTPQAGVQKAGATKDSSPATGSQAHGGAEASAAKAGVAGSGEAGSAGKAAPPAIGDYFMLDRAAFGALDEAGVLALHRCGALALAYAHFTSLQHLSWLMHMESRAAEQPGRGNPGPPAAARPQEEGAVAGFLEALALARQQEGALLPGLVADLAPDLAAGSGAGPALGPVAGRGDGDAP